MLLLVLVVAATFHGAGWHDGRCGHGQALGSLLDDGCLLDHGAHHDDGPHRHHDPHRHNEHSPGDERPVDFGDGHGCQLCLLGVGVPASPPATRVARLTERQATTPAPRSAPAAAQHPASRPQAARAPPISG